MIVQSQNELGQIAQGSPAAGQVAQALDQGGEGPQQTIQSNQSIDPGPVLQTVQAGDLITALYINTLVAAVQNLQGRVADLEGTIGDWSNQT